MMPHEDESGEPSVTHNKYVAVDELINLKHERAVVTGGATGIGFAISYWLAEAGAAVLIADLNLEEARKACQQPKDYGYQAAYVRCDVSQRMIDQGWGGCITNITSIDAVHHSARGLLSLDLSSYMTGSVVVVDGSHLIS
jgi:NAD(P)-dependent dehydrogenase (short-subunit alcohol dehydrogenase family)